MLYLLLLINSSSCFSQTDDTLIVDKWINYNRPRGAGDSYGINQEDKEYVTLQGDTLVRRVTISAEFNQVRMEESLVHGKRNGLAISYHPNGIIAEVSYYLNGRLWNVISRADSNGKLYNPGTLHNGNGIRYSFDQLGYESNCYETYVDGVATGPFYWQRDEAIAIKGMLNYRKDLVRHLPGKKVTFTNAGGKISTLVVDTAAFRQIFMDGQSEIKVLAVTSDSVEENVKEYKYIDHSFGDPAIVPNGLWQVVNPKTKIIMLTVVFDDNGNPIKVTRFDGKGKFVSEQKFTSYNMRVW